MRSVKGYNRNRNRADSVNDRIGELTRVLCCVFGMAFILSGLVFLTNRDFVQGGMLTSLGIVLAVLALGFRRFKVKTVLFEIEAQRN
jgi:small-conductance mechanosensitive channel